MHSNLAQSPQFQPQNRCHSEETQFADEESLIASCRPFPAGTFWVINKGKDRHDQWEIQGCSQ
jgi:hypothetical protein